MDTEASEAGAQAQEGPDPGHLVTILGVIHDVHIHIEGGDGGQEA